MMNSDRILPAGTAQAARHPLPDAHGRLVPVINPAALGNAGFCRDYGIKYAYLAGAMYKGISSKELVTAMGQAGLMAYFGSGGLSLATIEEALLYIRDKLSPGQAFGMNLLSSPTQSEREMLTVALYLKHGVRFVEAAAYTSITPALVRYRLHGVRLERDGSLRIPNRVMGKVSRPEVAEVFMQPAPPRIVAQLQAQGLITAEEAALSAHFPMAQELCVEADSGGHTDRGVASVLLPSIRALRDQIQHQHRYAQAIRIGTAGGIGTAEAVAAAFTLGADFVLTGSINQCTVEAGTSSAVKDMLQHINVQDTAFAPAGDMFESGAKVQVLKKGLLFPARANKLYELYSRYDSLDEIDPKTRLQIQEKYFRRSFEEVWAETEAHHATVNPDVIARAARDPKQKMALIFRWYFAHASRLAMRGSQEQSADYQVHCGPALGAFNQSVLGTELQDWRARHCADLAERLMTGAADLLTRQLEKLHEMTVFHRSAGAMS